MSCGINHILSPLGQIEIYKGALFFNPGYPVGANFKGYENIDGKINGYENILEKIKGCKLFNSLSFKGYEIIRR